MATLELVADTMATGGDAVAREPSGRVVFVTGALPGERVLADVVATRRDYARAVAVEVLEASPYRTVPPCPQVTAGCGGCGWQHVDHDAQLALKHSVVVDTLRRLGGLDEPEVRIGPSLAPTGFRTSARLHAGPDGSVGFRAVRSHAVVATSSCLVLHPLLDELLGSLRVHGAPEVLVRCGARTGERLVTAWPPATAGRARLTGVPDGVAVGPGSAIHEWVGGRRFRVSAGSFFQARADGADVLVELVRAEATAGGLPDGAVVDLYAGVGLFAATVPGDGAGRRPVVAVEQAVSAVDDARVNLADLGVSVVRSEVARWRAVPAGLVVADPARPGLGRAAAAVVAATGAARIVLVSCDAASLARDARLLSAHGYRHVRSTLVDLFPHTPHVEVVTRFERR